MTAFVHFVLYETRLKLAIEKLYFTRWLEPYELKRFKIGRDKPCMGTGIALFQSIPYLAVKALHIYIKALSIRRIEYHMKRPLGLFFGVYLRAVLLLLVFQMLGTLTPVVLFPDQVFGQIPYAPTLEGQYIIKNFVLISAALVLGATVRGGRLVADPRLSQEQRTDRSLEEVAA